MIVVIIDCATLWRQSMVEAAMGSSLSVAAVVINRGDGGLCQWRWQGWTRAKVDEGARVRAYPPWQQ